MYLAFNWLKKTNDVTFLPLMYVVHHYPAEKGYTVIQITNMFTVERES